MASTKKPGRGKAAARREALTRDEQEAEFRSILEQHRSDPDMLMVIRVLLDVVVSTDDDDVVASAALSDIAARVPWMLDEIAANYARNGFGAEVQ